MAFKSVDPIIWKHEKEGDSLTGWLMSVHPESGKYKGTAYNIEEMGTEQKFVVFGNNVLDDKMSFLKKGVLLKIVFKGKKESANKQMYNDYEVFVDDGKDPVDPKIVKIINDEDSELKDLIVKEGTPVPTLN